MSYGVVIAEDYKMVREVFAATVRNAENYRLEGSFATAAEAAAFCCAHPADLVLMDVLMPGSVSGLEAARRIKSACPETKIVIVTSMPEVSYLRRARELGADSFWHKELQEQPLLELLDRTMAGESVYPGTAPSVQIGNADAADFTERELDVLHELVGGASNLEIAESLNISETTVKSHITNMLQKTGYRSRLELAVKARHLGVAIKD
jgi:two-component system vancomycin resistance associated response regulator VraR